MAKLPLKDLLWGVLLGAPASLSEEGVVIGPFYCWARLRKKLLPVAGALLCWAEAEQVIFSVYFREFGVEAHFPWVDLHGIRVPVLKKIPREVFTKFREGEKTVYRTSREANLVLRTGFVFKYCCPYVLVLERSTGLERRPPRPPEGSARSSHPEFEFSDLQSQGG